MPFFEHERQKEHNKHDDAKNKNMLKLMINNDNAGLIAAVYRSLRRALVRPMMLWSKKPSAFILMFVFVIQVSTFSQTASPQSPNIIIFYADDLGYGDLSCYGAKAVITTHIDKLAKNGIRFTDAHCTAATCTPSRFSLLTGMYAFRNNAAILPGDAPLIISPSMPTLPKMLRASGYATGVVGKWHLGLGSGTIDWNGAIAPGPKELGFDYHFIIPATTDRVPTVFVENGRVPNLDPSDPIKVNYAQMIGDEPTGLSNPELLKQTADTQHSNTIINGISRIGYMTGGKTARWIDEEIPMVLDAKAKAFIVENKQKPFFLYYAFPNIHVPRAPNKKFVGATRMGARGDVIAEMDWLTGEIIYLLDSLNISNNTLIVFSSDNGPVLNDGYGDFSEDRVGSHKPAGIYRGGKYSAYEAGTRVPMIVYWKGKVEPKRSGALVSHVDLYASLAKLVGTSLKSGEAPDSQSQLEVWLGKTEQGRTFLLEESYTFSLRKGPWKYVAPMEKEGPAWLRNKKIETGLRRSPALYNLQSDPLEQKDVSAQQPTLLNQLQAVLERIRKEAGAEKIMNK